ncbi:MAG: GTPase Era [Gammaproteobacteria bacterium]|jgi:GTP-binding protein Era|nr:GTPase Era [Gammaproteobacteria bacterium]
MVTVAGRANVGKSTLVNRLVGHKVSITSPLPQTTRSRVMGIKNKGDAQIVYIDTPGLHVDAKRTIDRYMNRAARGSLEGVDCVILVISAPGWVAQDQQIFDLVQDQSCPVILGINKIDTMKDRQQLLPLIEQSSGKMPFAEIVPVSALTGENVVDLEKSVLGYLPEQPPLFPADQITDRSDKFVAAEFVREQVFRHTRQEVPYAVAVSVEQFEQTPKLLRIGAVVWVEKESQKGIIIGRAGDRLKKMGRLARERMEGYFESKVHLELWVKVREGWADSEVLLRSIEYGDE